jgi:outer membrane protein assembly factor BamB
LTSTGTKKWEYEFPASMLNAAPTIGSNGVIYQGTDDFKLYAITAQGTMEWAFTTGGKIQTSAAIAADGTIYVGSADGKLYAITSAGVEKWSFTASASILSSPMIGADGTIYFGDNGGKFYAVTSSGTQKWVFTTVDDNPFLGSPVMDTDGTIYVGTKRGPTTDVGVFYALKADGTEKWKKEMPKGDEVAGSAQYFQNDILGTPTVGKDGSIYIAFNDGNMYALRNDGTVKFTFKVSLDDASNRWDQAIWTSPALTEDGKLYFQDYSGYIYAVQVSASGLADSAWPTRGKRLKRSGL